MTLCAASVRCVFYDRQRDSPAELEGSLPICEGCLSAGERAVSALPFDYVSLEQQLPPSLGVWGDGMPTVGDEHPIPLNLAVEALQAEIHRVVTTWEDAVRDVHKLSDSVTKGVRAGWAVQAAVQILQPRIAVLAAIPPLEIRDYPELDEDEPHRFQMIEYVTLPGWRAVLDFQRLHNRARGLLGLIDALPTRMVGVQCRNKDCDQMALYRDPGEEDVRCGACGLRYSREEYEQWVKLVRGHLHCPECDGKVDGVGSPDEYGYAVVKPCGHEMPVKQGLYAEYSRTREVA